MHVFILKYIHMFYMSNKLFSVPTLLSMFMDIFWMVLPSKLEFCLEFV